MDFNETFVKSAQFLFYFLMSAGGNLQAVLKDIIYIMMVGLKPRCNQILSAEPIGT